MIQEQKIVVAARALMALIFIVAGIRKLLAWGASVGYFTKLGIPLPELLLALTIAFEIVGGIALVIGWQTRYVAIALAFFTMVSAFIAHAFWAAEPPQFNGQLLNFLKNAAMAGGFLLFYATAKSQPHHWLRRKTEPAIASTAAHAHH